jgi:chemotaxis response regulator CheB
MTADKRKGKSKRGSSVSVDNKLAHEEIARSTASPDAPVVVGLGTSAGGVEALEQLFRSMPPDSWLEFAKKTVEQYDCPIWVESKVREGSTSYNSFPDVGAAIIGR